ncbi:MAG: tyrosine--tRNA ligase [Planctomycetes bacterium]|nr:tyrosine--tRNA ligase [Planctomycetota bacterium]
MKEPTAVDPALAREVQRQLAILMRGVVDCVAADDLARRLAAALAAGRPLRVKLGFDPTSSDLHVGHAVVLRKLRQFQDLGHHAIFIVGGATAMLGDPSGKDKTRPTLTREQVERNAQSYLEQAFKVVRREERYADGRAGEIEVRNNADWFLELRFADFIRLCSKMTVARMIERDNFTKRMKEGAPIGIHEFVYPLLQGQDSVEVKADVELGGTDQLFNLLVGRDLQADAGQPPQICMTMKVLPGLDGVQKMSKSLGNYVGLTFPPDEVFGKVMSVPDALIPLWVELLTDRFVAEQGEASLAAALASNPRETKAGVAESITAWLHGEQAAGEARMRFDRVFKEKDVSHDAPERVLPRAEVPEGKLWIVDLLCRLEFAASRSEARRLVQGNGVKLNGVVAADDKLEVDLREPVLLQAGKRRFAWVSVR